MSKATESRDCKERLLGEMRAKLAGLTTAQVCEGFIATNTKNSPEIPTVRGVLMDELQARDSGAFELWMETNDIALMDNPTHFYVK
jgi:hypothetical protein